MSERARGARHRGREPGRGRRPGPPPAGVQRRLPDEILRSRLVDRLEERWTHPVSVIQAGAGFGKSTLLAQAVRANTLAPKGIDVWYACGPGDVDGDVLGSALLRALDVDRPVSDVAAQIGETLAAYSPLDVCVVLDDAHEIRPGSSGAALVDQVVRRLPDNAHVVLATRHTVPAALSRLRAADCLLEIGEPDLLFTADETAAMATRLGRQADAASTLGGWPALVRLALAVRPHVAIDFAQEEVLSQLTRDQRRALFVLAHFGYADADRVRRAIDEDVDLAGLALTVPLVSCTEDGRFRAHELWAAALLRVLDADDIGELRARVLRELLADGDLARAGGLAMAHDDLDGLGAVAREIVRRNTVALPVDMVRPWVEVLVGRRPDAPDTQLLRAAFGHALDYRDASVDAELDAAAAAFTRRGDGDGQLVALVVATVVAYRRGDVTRLVEVAVRAEAVPGSRHDALLDVALRAIAAMAAEMTGDLGRAVAELEAAPFARVPPAISTSAQRLLMQCLLLSGRADDAVAVARNLLAQRPDHTTRYLSAFASWMAGDPTELLALYRPSVDIPAVTSRDFFVRRTLVAAMLASTGQNDAVHRLVAESSSVAISTTNARDAVLDAVARALCAVVDHDEASAARLVTEVVAAHADSPILDQHLRRFLPLVYVLDPSVRAGWDEASMGPTHEHARRASQWLVDLRAGHPAHGGQARRRQGIHGLSLALGGGAGRPVARPSPPRRCPVGGVAGRPGARADPRRVPLPGGRRGSVRPGRHGPTGAPAGGAHPAARDLRARASAGRLRRPACGTCRVAARPRAHPALAVGRPPRPEPGAGHGPALAGLAGPRRCSQPPGDAHLSAPAIGAGTTRRRGIVPPPGRWLDHRLASFSIPRGRPVGASPPAA